MHFGKCYCCSKIIEIESVLEFEQQCECKHKVSRRYHGICKRKSSDNVTECTISLFGFEYERFVIY